MSDRVRSGVVIFRFVNGCQRVDIYPEDEPLETVLDTIDNMMEPLESVTLLSAYGEQHMEVVEE